MMRDVLAAQDADDLKVISAKLQDAVAQVGDLVWLPKARRFAALFNRFKWEESGARRNLRVRSGLHFDSVLSVQSQKIMRGDRRAVLSLLDIAFTSNGGEDPAGEIELVFAGGGAVRLKVECIDAELVDVSGEWAAIARPDHEN